jgi:hypothetical protein
VLAFDQKDHFEYAGAAGGFLDAFGYPYCRGRIFDQTEKDSGQYDNETDIFWASGACFFIRSSVYHELGGFDDEFFAHMEEIDLCWRIHAQGLKIRFLPDSIIYHVGGGTLSKSNPTKTYLNFRNGLSILIKNMPLGELLWKLPFRILLDIAAAYQFWVTNSFAHFKAVARAHLYILFHLPSLIRKRREIGQVKRDQSLLPVHFLVYNYFVKGKKTYTELTQ